MALFLALEVWGWADQVPRLQKTFVRLSKKSNAITVAFNRTRPSKIFP